MAMAAPRLHELKAEARIGAGAFGEVYVCSASNWGQAREADRARTTPLIKAPRDKPRGGSGARRPHGRLRVDTGRVVADLWALKKVSKTRLEATSMLEQAHREFEVLRIASQHPFVVGMHWVQETAGSIYACMEYCPGGDLFTHMTRGSLTRTDSKPVLAELALALNFLHRNDIIYRDLKPENVALSENGHVRLLDFGLALPLTESDRNEATGRLEVLCSSGTLEYAAPEVLCRETHGFEADWWSFGVLTHELLTGTSLFEYDDSVTTCQFICTHPIVFEESIERGSVEDAFLRGLLQRKRSERLGYDLRNFETDILQHPFFAEVDIDALMEQSEPLPFFLRVSSRLDVSNVGVHKDAGRVSRSAPSCV